jgi:hypothetical protein
MQPAPTTVPQVSGFVIVILDSLVSSYGDLLLHRLFPRRLDGVDHE